MFSKARLLLDLLEEQEELPGPKAPQEGPVLIYMEHEGEQVQIGAAKDRAEVDAWMALWADWAADNDWDAGMEILIQDGDQKLMALAPGEWEPLPEAKSFNKKEDWEAALKKALTGGSIRYVSAGDKIEAYSGSEYLGYWDKKDNHGVIKGDL